MQHDHTPKKFYFGLGPQNILTNALVSGNLNIFPLTPLVGSKGLGKI